MAKLTGAAKAKFLARMARGRKAKARRHHRKAKAPRARKRSHNNPIAYVVNPMEAASTMATNPRRRRHRKIRDNRKRRYRRHDNPFFRRRRRRDNPLKLGGFVKPLMGVAIPAAAAGFACNFIDSKFLGSRGAIIRIGAKVLEAGAALMLLKKRPAMAAAAAGAIIGSLTGEFGTKAGGGVLAASKPAAIKELAEMAAGDGEMALLLSEELKGMGLLLSPAGGDSMSADDLSGEDMGEETISADLDADEY